MSWHHGLFDVMADGSKTCLYAYFCPPCALASARSDYDNSPFAFNLLCGSGVWFRHTIRKGYGIEGNCCLDILTAQFCGCCSIIQITAQVKKAGSKHDAAKH
ncbi:hypothetical protein Pelo_9911 [Pelomyxa schiedti]|nr:hypothetical protein Pelo_9911 [Pelomyxa schiedti]